MTPESAKKIFNRNLEVVITKIDNDQDLGGVGKDEYNAMLSLFKDTMNELFDSMTAPVPKTVPSYREMIQQEDRAVAIQEAIRLKEAEQIAKGKAHLAENAERMVLCEGGPADATYAPIAGDMPPGARTHVGGAIYCLTPEGLVHDAGATQRFLDGAKTG